VFANYGYPRMALLEFFTFPPPQRSLHSKIKPMKLEPEFCGLQHIFNSSAKGLKMLYVCSIKTSEISNPDTQDNIPKINFHLKVSAKQTPKKRK
jgi:hypothetical protein